MLNSQTERAEPYTIFTGPLARGGGSGFEGSDEPLLKINSTTKIGILNQQALINSINSESIEPPPKFRTPSHIFSGYGHDIVQALATSFDIFKIVRIYYLLKFLLALPSNFLWDSFV